jgi:hypothetical protein
MFQRRSSQQPTVFCRAEWWLGRQSTSPSWEVTKLTPRIARSQIQMEKNRSEVTGPFRDLKESSWKSNHGGPSGRSVSSVAAMSPFDESYERKKLYFNFPCHKQIHCRSDWTPRPWIGFSVFSCQLMYADHLFQFVIARSIVDRLETDQTVCRSRELSHSLS